MTLYPSDVILEAQTLCAFVPQGEPAQLALVNEAVGEVTRDLEWPRARMFRLMEPGATEYDLPPHLQVYAAFIGARRLIKGDPGQTRVRRASGPWHIFETAGANAMPTPEHTHLGRLPEWSVREGILILSEAAQEASPITVDVLLVPRVLNSLSQPLVFTEPFKSVLAQAVAESVCHSSTEDSARDLERKIEREYNIQVRHLRQEFLS